MGTCVRCLAPLPDPLPYVNHRFECARCGEPLFSPHYADELRAAAADHRVLNGVIDQWCEAGVYRMIDRLAEHARQLDQLREVLELHEPHRRRPATARREAVRAIVAGHDHPETAWRACVDAGLVPATWLHDARRRFIDDDGNVVGHPGRLSDCVAIAADIDGVLEAEHQLRCLVKALAPWGVTEADEHYWYPSYDDDYDIDTGPVRSALASLELVSVDFDGSVELAAVGDLLWHERGRTLQEPPSYLAKSLPPLVSTFRAKPTATLPSPFAHILALLRTGYGFELDGAWPRYQPVLLYPA